MVNYFPPKPEYPKNYDNDSNLYLVYNTSESVTLENNHPWSAEISIKPVDDDKPEVWADNGFATINGELFYYDEVEKTEPVGSGLIVGKIVVDSFGGISSIPVIDGGSGYYFPSIKVVGKGSDAVLEAVVVDGSITNIKVLQTGRGYKPSTTSLNFEGKINKFKRCCRNLGGTHTKFNNAGSEVRGFVIAEHHNQIADAIINVENFVGINFDTRKETLDWRIRNLQNLPIILDDYSCPDVDFSFYTVSEDPVLGTTIQYSVVITGIYNTYSLDFGDGQNTQTSTLGTHTYAANSTIDPVVTVTTDRCTIVQTPVSRVLATEPTAPQTSTGFSINIPTIPTIPPIVFPSIPIPQTPQIPPIVFPCLDIGPIGPISVPSIIVIEPPVPSVISFGPVPSFPSVVSFVNIPSIPTLISMTNPNIPTIIDINSPNIPTTISINDPNIPSRISIISPNIPTTISINDPNIPTTISINEPYIPTNISINQPNIPTTISINEPYIPTTISINEPYIPTNIVINEPYIPTTISINDPYIPTLISIIEPFIPTVISFENPPVGNWTVSWENPPAYNWYVSWETPPAAGWYISWEDPTLFSWWNNSWWVSWEDPTLFSWWNNSWYVSWQDPTANSWWYNSWYVSWEDPRTTSWWSDTWYVSWAPPPPVSCIITVSCASSTPMLGSKSGNIDVEDLYPDDLVPLNVGDSLGIPSEINVVFPNEIPDIKVVHDVPAIIRVLSPDMPSEIRFNMGDISIPSEIKIISAGIPTLIELVATNLPSAIEINANNLPKSIAIEVPDSLPSIKIDASSLPSTIQVVGVPSTIELVGAPSEISLVLPEKPEIELVYKGAPIDVKVNLDINRLTGGDDKGQCVAIVPCGN